MAAISRDMGAMRCPGSVVDCAARRSTPPAPPLALQVELKQIKRQRTLENITLLTTYELNSTPISHFFFIFPIRILYFSGGFGVLGLYQKPSVLRTDPFEPSRGPPDLLRIGPFESSKNPPELLRTYPPDLLRSDPLEPSRGPPELSHSEQVSMLRSGCVTFILLLFILIYTHITSWG